MILRNPGELSRPKSTDLTHSSKKSGSADGNGPPPFELTASSQRGSRSSTRKDSFSEWTRISASPP